MLHTLNVGHNCMTSSLPSSWSGMPLRSFKADGNPGLYGPLPTSWASLPLVELWLSETGAIPAPLIEPCHFLIDFQWPSYVTAFLMSLQPTVAGRDQNKSPPFSSIQGVSGNLPQEWSTMTALQELQLSRTAVSGTLPAQWAFMSSLESIMLESAKSLSGELPPAWATMTALKNINLQHCNFTGTIPEAWGKLQSLQSMNASHNSLSGSIPSTWTLLTRLQSVDLSNNIMRGEVTWHSLLRGSITAAPPTSSRTCCVLPMPCFRFVPQAQCHPAFLVSGLYRQYA